MGVTYTFVDGTTAQAGEVNQNFTDAINSSLKLIKLNSFGLTSGFSNILPFSATRWQNASALTTDAGATNSANPYGKSYAAICRENKAKAVSWSGNGADWEYTTDSGATWNTTTTAPPNITSITCVDFRREGRIYVAGDVSATTGLWYSTDGGDNFTQVAGTFDEFVGVSMHDDTHGIAIDNDSNIFFTVNGTTWVDSTYQMSTPSGAPSNCDIEVTASGAAIGNFNALMVFRQSSSSVGGGAVGYCSKFDGTGNSVAVVSHRSAQGGYSSATNFYKLTNGSICYAAEQSNSADSAGNWYGSQGVLYVTDDSGVSWYVIPLGPTSIANSSNEPSYPVMGDNITEYDTNKILLPAYLYKLFQIDLGAFS